MLNIEETFKKFYPELSQKKLKRLIDTFRKYQKRNAHKEITLYDGVLETIKTLRIRKKQLAIVTTKHINQIEHILRVFKIYNYFDVVFGRGMMEFTKPQSECFDYVFQHLKTPVLKDNFLMIGDSNVDCEFSHNSQITMMGVSWGTDSPTTLKRAGAKYILNNISDLLKFT
jgi:HAD superfamily hydrolase (TIGR01549 family)